MTLGLISDARIEQEAAYLIRRAKRDAQRAVFADLPDPKEYAFHLEPEFVEALICARPFQSYGVLIDLKHEYLIPKMRSMGLVGFHPDRRHGRGITAFALSVRRALKDMEI